MRDKTVVIAVRDDGIPVGEVIFFMLFHGKAAVGKSRMTMQGCLVLSFVRQKMVFHSGFDLSAAFSALFEQIKKKLKISSYLIIAILFHLSSILLDCF